jgi:hypothetical protein
MSHKSLFAVLVCLSVIPSGINATPRLDGHMGNPSSPQDRLACDQELFWGDLTPEIGLGCSSGPNDVAVGVTATLTPPIAITSHFYNIFTNVAPFIDHLDFVVWEAGELPGNEVCRESIAPNWEVGNHTVAIQGCCIDSNEFYFGQNQNQTQAGVIRWGFDTSSSAERSYVRAPACAGEDFVLIDELGFPGNWVMSVCVAECPVVPVELESWGSLKARYH